MLGHGDEDLALRAADLADRLPDRLAPLARIAYNYRWCWYPGGKDVFSAINEDTSLPFSIALVRI